MVKIVRLTWFPKITDKQWYISFVKKRISLSHPNLQSLYSMIFLQTFWLLFSTIYKSESSEEKPTNRMIECCLKKLSDDFFLLHFPFIEIGSAWNAIPFLAWDIEGWKYKILEENKVTFWHFDGHTFWFKSFSHVQYQVSRRTKVGFSFFFSTELRKRKSSLFLDQYQNKIKIHFLFKCINWNHKSFWTFMPIVE